MMRHASSANVYGTKLRGGVNKKKGASVQRGDNELEGRVNKKPHEPRSC